MWLQSSLAMLLFRSLAIGLTAACLWLLVDTQRSVGKVEYLNRHALVAARGHDMSASRPTTPSNATLVDVASGVSPQVVSSLVKLDAGEHVTSVGDVRVDNDLAAGTLIAQSAGHRDSFIDLEVAGPTSKRRVLVLMH